MCADCRQKTPSKNTHHHTHHHLRHAPLLGPHHSPTFLPSLLPPSPTPISNIPFIFSLSLVHVCLESVLSTSWSCLAVASITRVYPRVAGGENRLVSCLRKTQQVSDFPSLAAERDKVIALTLNWCPNVRIEKCADI